MAWRIEGWLGPERGGDAEVWLWMQLAYDLWRERQRPAPRVTRAKAVTTEPARYADGPCGDLTSVTLRYTVAAMIRSWKHKGLQRFFEKGSRAGIQPHHAERLARQLAQLDAAKRAADMNVPGWRLHPLGAGDWSIWVNGNWRVTFAFEGEDAVAVDYRDYH